MTQIFPIFGIYWSYLWLVMIELISRFDTKFANSWISANAWAKRVVYVIFWFYIATELGGTL